jgi:glycosyltransferase involved in cell wall biosynthesis
MARLLYGDSSMKVLFLLTNGFAIGGTVRTTFNLAGALAARGHDVEILSTHRGRDVPQLALDPRVRLMALLENRPKHPDYDAADPRRGRKVKVYPAADYRSANYDLLAEDRYERYLRSSDADVVIATRAGLIAYAAKFAPGRMVRIGQEHLTRMQQRAAMRRRLPRFIRKLDAFVTVTEHDAADYRAHLRWLRGTQVLFIPNSIPAPHVAPSDGSSRIVVAAGRLVQIKRYDLLLRAFAEVVAQRPQWQLRIYGGGDQNEALRRLVLELGLHNNVLLMGSYAPLDPEWAKGAVSASSADREPFGMTLVEAMRCGVPVVSTDAEWGPREILTDGVDGMLTPVGDAGGLSAALLRLTGDEPARRAMAAAALASSARYDPDAIAARYEQLFEELAAKKKPRRRPAAAAEPPPVLGPAPTLTQPVMDCEVLPSGDVLLSPGSGVPEGSELVWRKVSKELIEVPQKSLTVALGDLPEGSWQLRLPNGDLVMAGVRETRALLEPPGEGGIHRQLPYRMINNCLGLRVWERPVHAEVGEVQADAGGVHVRGRLFGATFPGLTPTLRLTGPEKAVREVPAEALSPVDFRVTVPALPAGDWNLWITCGDDGPVVRLGRFLDDVIGKKTAYVLPATTIDGLRVQPVYLWGNEFSVQVRG